MKRLLPFLLVGLALIVIAGGLLLASPRLRQTVSLYLATWRADIFYALNPPAEDVFVPESVVAQAVEGTLQARVTPSPSATLQPTATLEITATPAPTLTPTIEPTPLPGEVKLTGMRHEYQQWNNCGPATLAVALSYWGWEGDQRDTAGWIKPNPRDKNTSADELVAYVEAETNLRALLRVGGNLQILKQLVAAGFPVIIERGFDGYDDEGWMGHYELVSGYSDSYGKVITQDVLIMADFPVPYEELLNYWRAFNYVFVVVYPPEREAALLQALGPLADEDASYGLALERARAEQPVVSGREVFFSLFNQAMSLLHAGDTQTAAALFDQAFVVYADLPEEARPWRMVWYQHGPFPAYFAQGRYADVVSLADHTLSRTGEPALEESFLWRARAKAALGDSQAAINDLREALKWHPGWPLALEELQRLGVTP
jgi:tetratricopeptide (TPR) repeat protein